MMRGKLAKPQGSILRVAGLVNILAAGWQVSQYVKFHEWTNLAAGIFSLLAGIAVLIVHWHINHPKIPKWAEEAMSNGAGKLIIKEVGE